MKDDRHERKREREVVFPRTPYSMNSLFSEFFRKFGGVFLEVCETISGGIWQVLRGKIKENYTEKIRKHKKNHF